MDLEIYITASFVSNAEQKRDVLLLLLLLTGGEDLFEIWKHFTGKQKVE